MASLWKRQKSKFWTACFTSPDGRQLKRSTKTTDRKVALKLANSWEDAARLKVTESQARRVISDIYAMVSGAQLGASSIKAFFAAWLERKKSEIEPATFGKYQNVATQFVNFMGDRAAHDMTRLTSKDVADFRDSITSRLSPATANVAIKVIRAALSHAKAEGLLNENVAERVGVVSGKQGTKRRAFTLPELKRILDGADDEWRGMILFGLYTGQRLQDIATLSWRNLDLERDELCLVTGKTTRQQIIPLATPLRGYIGTMKAGGDPKQPLFPRAFGIVERTGKVGMLSSQFYGLMANAGLVEARTHQKTGGGRSVRRKQNEISFHCLRHTATSLMKNAGISPAIVQEFIGHDSPEMSANYTHIEMSAMRKAAESLPDIFEA